MHTKKEVFIVMVVIAILFGIIFWASLPTKKSPPEERGDSTITYYTSVHYSAYDSGDGKCRLNAVTIPSLTETSPSSLILEKTLAEKEVRECKSRYLKWCDKTNPTDYEAFYRCEVYRKDLIETK